MKRELAAMESVLRSYFTADQNLDGVKDAGSAEIQKRLDILHYGFEARTKWTLEDAFPKTKAALATEKWNGFGKAFCTTEAFREEHLGLLPLKFAEFLEHQALSAAEKICAQKDLLLFQCQHAKLKSVFDDQNLAQLNESSVLSLQCTVQFLQEESSVWVVSRSRERFFETEVSLKLGEALLKMRRGRLSVLELMETLDSPEELSDFFAAAIQGHWLVV
jgi:hypothetical protein